MSSEQVLIWLKYRFIGDAVLSTPLLHALAARYERPHVLTAPHLRQLLGGEAGLELISNPNVKAGTDFFRQVRALRRERYAIAVLVNRSFRSALMARLAGIRRRIGFPTEGRGALLTDRVPYDLVGFEGDCYARLGDPLGLNVVGHPPRLTVSPEERHEGDQTRGKRRVGLLPGCTVTERAISADKAAKIAEALGEPLVLLGAESERRFADALLPLVPQALDLVGALTLRQTMGVVAGLSVVIGPDSGLIHVTTALGVPTVATFCFTPNVKWGHHYSPHTVFQTPDNTMDTMDVEYVVAAAQKALA